MDHNSKGFFQVTEVFLLFFLNFDYYLHKVKSVTVTWEYTGERKNNDEMGRFDRAKHRRDSSNRHHGRREAIPIS